MANKQKSNKTKNKKCNKKLTEKELENIAGGKIRYPEEREVN